ncbi:MAG: type I-B CRISPR-associated protein Cas8b/Csh1, partial [Bacillota bacterium]|nr:type I-B CRISPR-associated protein Cas8b/Csh1 [Bacillota bacterium]
KKISEKLIETYINSKNIESIEEFKYRINKLLQKETYYLINFVFIDIGQNGIKIKKIIEDVNPDIFKKIRDADVDSKEVVNKYYMYKNDYKFGGLDSVYFTLPLTISGSDITNYRLMLDIYSNILNLKKLNYKTLIKKWTDIYSIIYYENSSYNVSPKTNKIRALESKITDVIYILEFYKNLGIIERAKGGLSVKIDLDDKMLNFIKEMDYNDEKTAMFIMGYLVGEIGRKQNRNSENNDGSYKPILNKINFNGIDMKRIVRLSTDIFEKMRQLKIVSYNEKIYHQMMKLINKKKSNWSLDKNENLFYLMTGYGFKNYKEKNEKEEENGNE